MTAATYKRAAPALPLFGDAYLADTRHLTLEEHGAYLQLLMIAWRSEGCSLPDDDARLALMLGVSAARWRKLRPNVMAFWKAEGGRWFQPRLTKEREFVEQKSQKNRTSANARWNPQHIENNDGAACERISERNAPSPSPSPSPPEKKNTDAARLRLALIDDALAIWSAAAERRKWKPISPRVTQTVERKLGARLKEEGLDGWAAAIARAEASTWLGGTDPPAWFTFHFLLSPDNFAKLIGGNYDRAYTGAARQQQSPWLDARAELSEQHVPCPRTH